MLRHFEATLFGAEDTETVEIPHGFAPGTLRGTLWGGNLSLLAHLAGTPYMPDVAGGLLYIEEIAEEPYAVERMLLQLLHAGILQRQQAVLLGDFRDCVPTNTARYPYCMAEAIDTLRAILPCPVLAGLPIGHVARKLTLPFGAEAELRLREDGWTLRWPGLGR
jgi:muramoyltetrapeptide carboxypeptidase